MYNIKLQNMTKEDAYDLDRLLAYCAEVAVQEATAENGESYDKKTNISSDALKMLMTCYQTSEFVNKDKTHRAHVKKRLETELNRRVYLEGTDRLELLLPVMAFNLLVSNEYNRDTVNKRIKEDKGRQPTKTGDEFPYNRWKHVDPYSIKRSENPKKTKTFAQKFVALKKQISASKKFSICFSEDVLFVSVLLHNYRDVVKCQDIARISLFLRTVLVKSYNPSKPLDTLIRMYLVNHTSNSLFRSYALCDENYGTAINNQKRDNYLLSFFYDSFAHNKEGKIIEKDPVFCDSDNTELIPPDPQSEEEYHGMCFSQIYQEIASNYTISEDALNELLNFYLDADILENYATLEDDTKQLADAIINYLKKRTEIARAYLTDAIVNFVLWKSHQVKPYPVLHLNTQWQKTMHGKVIDRLLSLSKISRY